MQYIPTLIHLFNKQNKNTKIKIFFCIFGKTNTVYPINYAPIGIHLQNCSDGSPVPTWLLYSINSFTVNISHLKMCFFFIYLVYATICGAFRNFLQS